MASLYLYQPSQALAGVFAALFGSSVLFHVYQNQRMAYWRVTVFMVWGGVVFTSGWILRCLSAQDPTNLALYVAQTVCIYAGPPIYAAAEYNILARLMHYLPMHALLNPDRLLWVFIYIGTAVESLTAAGAARYAVARGNLALYRSGGMLVSIALVLQAVVECLFIAAVFLMHRRCTRAGTLPKNVQRVCLTLYGTSVLVTIRCIARAVEAFSVYTVASCDSFCLVLLEHEWYLYVFEASPMLLYTVWLNFMHPGCYLPRDRKQFLDLDGTTERMGPGWVDRRSSCATFMDPFDIQGVRDGKSNHEQYWLEGRRWPLSDTGCFAQGIGSNVR